MTRARVLIILLVAKLAAGAAAWFVVGESFQLGDTEAYLAGEYLARQNPLSTAYLMSAAGAVITAVVGVGYMANVPLNVLAWAGLARETRPLRLGSRAWLGLLVLLLSPSYLLWTSVHSKEAFVNFLLGWVLLYALLQAKGGRASRTGWVTAGLAGLLLGLFKPLFLPAVLWALLLTRVVPRVAHPKTVSLGATLAVSAAGVVFLFAAAPILEPLVSTFHLHFSTEGTYTREGHRWQGLGELIRSMPEGAVVSFVGPTVSEALTDPLLLPFLVEGMVIGGVSTWLILRGSVTRRSIYLSRLLLLAGFFLLLVVAHYPFGYFNVGSALRYRQGFYGPMIIFLFAFAFDQDLRLGRVPEGP